MRFFVVISLIILLSACVPKRETYCTSKGKEPYTKEYDQCVKYYDQQQQIFDKDDDACLTEAKKLYPDRLYDRSFPYRYLDRTGRITRHYMFDDNYEYNTQLDMLRQKIITQCMYDKGWKSSRDWTAGRR